MTTKQVLVGRGLCLNCTGPLTLRHERESHYCSPCEVDRLRARVAELEERDEQWAKKWDAAVETGGNNTQRALEEVARLKSIIDEALERTKERDAALEEVARLRGLLKEVE